MILYDVKTKHDTYGDKVLFEFLSDAKRYLSGAKRNGIDAELISVETKKDDCVFLGCHPFMGNIWIVK